MPDALAEQIEAFRNLLPQILREHGSVWAVIADRRLVSTFKDFADAAKYANDRYPNQQVLIRHTAKREEFVPFIVIDEKAQRGQATP